MDLWIYCSNPHPVRRLGAILKFWLIMGLISMFQSSPSPKTGRYFHSSLFTCITHRFQSSPSPKTGRYTLTLPANTREAFVPILTQSEDWALSQFNGLKVYDKQFQSSPSPKTGRYVAVIQPVNLFTLIVPILTQSEDWALF